MPPVTFPSVLNCLPMSTSCKTSSPLIHPDSSGPSLTAVPRTPDELLINRRDLSAHDREELEQLAFECASVPESYDIAISDGHVLRTPCGQGAMSVLVDGRFWHIAGGLLGPQSLKPRIIHWLRELSLERRRTIAVYNVSYEEALLFQQAGFVVNKFGEEPVLNLQDTDWSGKPFEWVRRQSNFCQRAELVVSEITQPDEQLALGKTLLSILNEDLSGRTFDRPLRLLEGEFNPHVLHRRRLFVARKKHEPDIEAFLACSPVQGGRSWAFETYRKRRNSTRGVTTYLFRSTMDQLRSEGVEQISLCLIPGRNVRNTAILGGDWRITRALSLWFSHMDFVFNVQGQDHFKSRFRPQYVDRYLCVAPGNTVASLFSFLKTTGAIHCNWKNLFTQLRRSVFHR
jgi:phosphatidylglycerol lysyltransferase